MRLPFGWAWVKANWRWFVPALLAAMAAMFIGIHQLIARSDAFAAASQFASGHRLIATQLGRIQSTELPWFGSAAISVSGDRGQAHFTLLLNGDKADARLYIEMEKRGIWEPRFARLMQAGGSVLLLDRSTSAACDGAASTAGCEPKSP